MRIAIKSAKCWSIFYGTRQKKNQKRTISRKCAYVYDVYYYNKLLFCCTHIDTYMIHIPFISIEEIERWMNMEYIELMLKNYIVSTPQVISTYNIRIFIAKPLVILNVRKISIFLGYKTLCLNKLF